MISGFGPGDMIALGALAYSSSGETRAFSPAVGSGTLTVVDGLQQAQLTLIGSYVTSNFTLTTDTSGETVIKYQA